MLIDAGQSIRGGLKTNKDITLCAFESLFRTTRRTPVYAKCSMFNAEKCVDLQAFSKKGRLDVSLH